MDPLTLKLICIPIILVLNSLFGGIPYILISRRERRGGITVQQTPKLTRVLSLASCFSAGVFLATCFVGLFPSVETKFRKVTKSLGRTISYPVPEVTVCAGFFAVWLLEQLLHKCVHMACAGADSGGNESGNVNLNGSTARGRDNSGNNQLLSGEQVNSGGHVSLLQHEEHEVVDYDDDEEHHYPEHIGTATEPSGEHHGHSHSHMAVNNNSTLRSILLTFALGSHSILEGLGFGLLDNVSQVLNMALAIVIHECLCALSLGLQLAHQKTRPCLVYVLIGTFAILIPLGIGIGLSLEASETSISGQIVTLVLQGMAAGTFIYVVFFEILPPEISVPKDRVLKVIFTALGFITIAVIRLISVKE